MNIYFLLKIYKWPFSGPQNLIQKKKNFIKNTQTYTYLNPYNPTLPYPTLP